MICTFHLFIYLKPRKEYAFAPPHLIELFLTWNEKSYMTICQKKKKIENTSRLNNKWVLHIKEYKAQNKTNKKKTVTISRIARGLH